MKLLLFLVLLATPAHALGLANGLKIGEVTDTSAVIWSRVTKHEDALRKVDEWDEKEPKQWSVPGMKGHLQIVLTPEGAEPGEQSLVRNAEVTAANDYCHQAKFGGLEPDTAYEVQVFARETADSKRSSSIGGSFRTAPKPDAEAALTFVVTTGQDFPRRDDLAHGHKIYRSMLELEPAFFVHTGDVLYYDKAKPFAKDIATARYKWNRLYALPYFRMFHRQVPSYWIHDDHDVLKNDCWPGQTYGELTWEQGLKVWREQIPQSDKPYRTFHWGKHIQVWFPEGREYRSPNTMKDGPDKSIFGAEQWRWIEETMRASNATHKFFVSATPVVGPDRKGKNDNHSNSGFAHEGKRLRKFLAGIPGCVVLNGDRHWQYHSIDPETGLQEFSCGPSSDKHAGGWKTDLQPDWQKYLRIKGGFLSVEADATRAVLRYHDVDGKIVHEVTVTNGR